MAEPRVTTAAGDLRGLQLDGVQAFKGVPYAAPPVGRNRWRPPQPLEPWAGVRDAVELAPSCPQPTQRPAGWTQEHATSEDCLYLNVWTPAADGARRPVLFWIHGGGYAIGSGSWPLYDGAALARRGDAVVITVNHRLGPFGYLHLGELAGEVFAASGNNGQLDLVAALKWVRNNVAAFGGDPGNVTVFGESGGGAKISTLLAMPLAQGLFHRAAIQSGPGLRVGSVAGGTKAARALLDEMGIEAHDVDKLWEVPADRLIAGGRGSMGYRPVLDGQVIPAHPGDALAGGTAVDVPVIIGCNRDESAGALPAELDDAGLEQRLATFGAEHVAEILAVYRDTHPGASNVDLLSFVLTDARMRYGSIRLAEQKAKGTASPVFQYFFTYDLAGRAGHGYEIQFVFDNVRQPIARSSASRQQLADVMSEAWLAFARDGDPNHPGMNKWPAFTVPERATMIFGRGECAPVQDPHAATRQLWDRLLARR